MTSASDHVTPRLFQAMSHAFMLHGHDSRKKSPVPSLAHLLSVCALVQMDGGDEDEAIAALLHDALEDKPDEVTKGEISEKYGPRVAGIVEACTDTPPSYSGGPKPPWRDRKEMYLAHISIADPGMLRVTIADKVDNLRAVLADHARIGDKLWSRFNAGKEDQIWYYSQVVEACKTAGASSPLLHELENLVRRVQRLAS